MTAFAGGFLVALSTSLLWWGVSKTPDGGTPSMFLFLCVLFGLGCALLKG